MDGGLVESLTEAEPDAPVLEAPPAVEDAPDAGKCSEKKKKSAMIEVFSSLFWENPWDP